MDAGRAAPSEAATHLPVRHAGSTPARRWTVRGDTLSGYWVGEFPVGADQRVSTLTGPGTPRSAARGSMAIYDDAGMYCALLADLHRLARLRLSSAPVPSSSRPWSNTDLTVCRQERHAARRWPLHRMTHGRPLRRRAPPPRPSTAGLSRACWSYERTLTCTGGRPGGRMRARWRAAAARGRQHLQADECCDGSRGNLSGHLHLPGRRPTATTARTAPRQRHCLG